MRSGGGVGGGWTSDERPCWERGQGLAGEIVAQMMQRTG